MKQEARSREMGWESHRKGWASGCIWLSLLCKQQCGGTGDAKVPDLRGKRLSRMDCHVRKDVAWSSVQLTSWLGRSLVSRPSTNLIAVNFHVIRGGEAFPFVPQVLRTLPLPSVSLLLYHTPPVMQFTILKAALSLLLTLGAISQVSANPVRPRPR